ncbi:MAG: hypothetical protein Q8Q33_10805, partial [Chlamydiota bacterium]|nr:hypothetical protein [Chlamydiota bacterium]
FSDALKIETKRMVFNLLGQVVLEFTFRASFDEQVKKLPPAFEEPPVEVPGGSVVIDSPSIIDIISEINFSNIINTALTLSKALISEIIIPEVVEENIENPLTPFLTYPPPIDFLIQSFPEPLPIDKFNFSGEAGLTGDDMEFLNLVSVGDDFVNVVDHLAEFSDITEDYFDQVEELRVNVEVTRAAVKRQEEIPSFQFEVQKFMSFEGDKQFNIGGGQAGFTLPNFLGMDPVYMGAPSKDLISVFANYHPLEGPDPFEQLSVLRTGLAMVQLNNLFGFSADLIFNKILAPTTPPTLPQIIEGQGSSPPFVFLIAEPDEPTALETMMMLFGELQILSLFEVVDSMLIDEAPQPLSLIYLLDFPYFLVGMNFYNLIGNPTLTGNSYLTNRNPLDWERSVTRYAYNEKGQVIYRSDLTYKSSAAELAILTITFGTVYGGLGEKISELTLRGELDMSAAVPPPFSIVLMPPVIMIPFIDALTADVSLIENAKLAHSADLGFISPLLPGAQHDLSRFEEIVKGIPDRVGPPIPEPIDPVDPMAMRIIDKATADTTIFGLGQPMQGVYLHEVGKGLAQVMGDAWRNTLVPEFFAEFEVLGSLMGSAMANVMDGFASMKIAPGAIAGVSTAMGFGLGLGFAPKFGPKDMAGIEGPVQVGKQFQFMEFEMADMETKALEGVQLPEPVLLPFSGQMANIIELGMGQSLLGAKLIGEGQYQIQLDDLSQYILSDLIYNNIGDLISYDYSPPTDPSTHYSAQMQYDDHFVSLIENVGSRRNHWTMEKMVYDYDIHNRVSSIITTGWDDAKAGAHSKSIKEFTHNSLGQRSMTEEWKYNWGIVVDAKRVWGEKKHIDDDGNVVYEEFWYEDHAGNIHHVTDVEMGKDEHGNFVVQKYRDENISTGEITNKTEITYDQWGGVTHYKDLDEFGNLIDEHTLLTDADNGKILSHTILHADGSKDVYNYENKQHIHYDAGYVEPNRWSYGVYIKDQIKTLLTPQLVKDALNSSSYIDKTLIWKVSGYTAPGLLNPQDYLIDMSWQIYTGTYPIDPDPNLTPFFVPLSFMMAPLIAYLLIKPKKTVTDMDEAYMKENQQMFADMQANMPNVSVKNTGEHSVTYHFYDPYGREVYTETTTIKAENEVITENKKKLKEIDRLNRIASIETWTGEKGTSKDYAKLTITDEDYKYGLLNHMKVTTLDKDGNLVTQDVWLHWKNGKLVKMSLGKAKPDSGIRIGGFTLQQGLLGLSVSLFSDLLGLNNQVYLDQSLVIGGLLSGSPMGMTILGVDLTLNAGIETIALVNDQLHSIFGEVDEFAVPAGTEIESIITQETAKGIFEKLFKLANDDQTNYLFKKENRKKLLSGYGKTGKTDHDSYEKVTNTYCTDGTGNVCKTDKKTWDSGSPGQYIYETEIIYTDNIGDIVKTEKTTRTVGVDVEDALAIEIPEDAGLPPTSFRYQDANGIWHTVEASYEETSDGGTKMIYSDTNEKTGKTEAYTETYDSNGFMTSYEHDGVKIDILREDGVVVGYKKSEKDSNGHWVQTDGVTQLTEAEKKALGEDVEAAYQYFKETDPTKINKDMKDDTKQAKKDAYKEALEKGLKDKPPVTFKDTTSTTTTYNKYNDKGLLIENTEIKGSDLTEATTELTTYYYYNQLGDIMREMIDTDEYGRIDADFIYQMLSDAKTDQEFIDAFKGLNKALQIYLLEKLEAQGVDVSSVLHEISTGYQYLTLSNLIIKPGDDEEGIGSLSLAQRLKTMIQAMTTKEFRDLLKKYHTGYLVIDRQQLAAMSEEQLMEWFTNLNYGERVALFQMMIGMSIATMPSGGGASAALLMGAVAMMDLQKVADTILKTGGLGGIILGAILYAALMSQFKQLIGNFMAVLAMYKPGDRYLSAMSGSILTLNSSKEDPAEFHNKTHEVKTYKRDQYGRVISMMSVNTDESNIIKYSKEINEYDDVGNRVHTTYIDIESGVRT